MYNILGLYNMFTVSTQIVANVDLDSVAYQLCWRI